MHKAKCDNPDGVDTTWHYQAPLYDAMRWYWSTLTWRPGGSTSLVLLLLDFICSTRSSLATRRLAEVTTLHARYDGDL